MSDDKKKKKGKALPVEEAFKILNYLFSAILLTFSSRRHIFPPSETFPDADAEVSFVKNTSGDYQIETIVENLNHVKKILKKEEDLVVWAEFPEIAPIPLGALQVENERGVLKTSLPQKPRVLFITIEENNRVGGPAPQRIFDSGEIVKD